MGTVSNRKSASRTTGVRKTRVSERIAESGSPAKPNFRLILGLSAVGAVVSLLLIPILTERPGHENKLASRAGGESVVSKSPAPPAARGMASSVPAPQVPEPPQAQPQTGTRAAPEPDGPAGLDPQNLPPGVTLSDPGVDAPVPPAARPSAPESGAGLVASPLPEAPPAARPAPPRDRAPDGGAPPALPREREGTAAPSGERQEPASPPSQSAEPADLPSRSDIRSWARSEAREFVGGVDSDGMPLYRFEIWLDARPDVRSAIRSVSYEYRAPSAQPASQSSAEAGDGFRVRFGAASCAEKATITVVMKDGRERSADVDGCRILN